MTRIVRLISLVTVLIAVCVLAAVRNSDCGETSAPNPAPTTPPKGEAVKAGVAGTSKPLGVATPSEDLAVREFVDLLKTEAERSEQATTHESDALDHTLTFFKEIVSVVGTLLLAAAGFLVWWQQTTGHTTLTQAKENLSTELQKRAEQAIEAAEKKLSAQLQDAANQSLESFNQKAKHLDDRFQEIHGQLDSFKEKMKHLDDQHQQTQVELSEMAAQTARSVTTSADSFAGRSIIWLDDQPHTTEDTRAELKKRSIDVDAVDSEQNLEAKLHNKSYDLIVSDMRRGVNPRAGLDYIRRIQNRDDLPPRLIFAPKKLCAPREDEIESLKDPTGRGFLGAVWTHEDFFRKVFDILRKEKPTSSQAHLQQNTNVDTASSSNRG